MILKLINIYYDGGLMINVNTMKKSIVLILVLLIASNITFAYPTAPALGSAGTYGAFTGAGAINNTGFTTLIGNIGTNVGAFNGFPPGTYTGASHIADAASLAAKNDLINAWSVSGLIPCDIVLGPTMGSGQILTPGTYCVGSAATIDGSMIFDAEGDPNAVFVVKIDGALVGGASTQIQLLNQAQACNIYWRINGALTVAANSSIKGNIIAFGAINLLGGTSLEGRALSIEGAITLSENAMTLPLDKGVTVVTTIPYDLTITSLRSGGTLTLGADAAAISDKGLLWSYSNNPTLLNYVGKHSAGSGPSSGFATFLYQITGLTEGVTVYIRAYAVNNDDTYYGLTRAVSPIPTLGQWGLISMVVIFASLGGWFVWKKS